MKAPLVVLIAIVVSILGFLVVYSLQHDMTTAKSGQAAAGGYGAAAPAAGGYGAAHTPAAGGYGAAPAPKSGGYGAPPAGGGYGR